MALSDAQFDAWRGRRTARLTGVPWLRSKPTRQGTGVVWYVADEVLVRDQHVGAAQQVMRGFGHAARDVLDETAPVPGIRRYKVRGLRSADVVDEIRRRVGGVGGAASLNHVLVAAPFQHGGPFGPPAAVASPSLTFAPSTTTPTAHVAVLDTAMWADSPLPPDSYQATPADYETEADVDQDGIVDGEVGHANFVIGVLRAHTNAARVSAVRVLDRYGLCTVVELAAALANLDPSVSVVNLSLGGFTDDGQPPEVLRLALRNLLRNRDVVVTAAAGNNGVSDEPYWPAAFAGSREDWSGQVVSVAAHDGQVVCPWSNTGAWVRVAAPGADVTSTFIHHAEFASGWALWSGTSFATPRVSAAIAARMVSGSGAVQATGKVLADAMMPLSGPYPWL